MHIIIYLLLSNRIQRYGFFSFFLHFLLILSTPSIRTFFSYNFLVIYQHLTRVSVFSNLRTNRWEKKKNSPRPRKQNIFCWFTCTFHFIRAWHTGSMGSLFFVFQVRNVLFWKRRLRPKIVHWNWMRVLDSCMSLTSIYHFLISLTFQHWPAQAINFIVLPSLLLLLLLNENTK